MKPTPDSVKHPDSVLEPLRRVLERLRKDWGYIAAILGIAGIGYWYGSSNNADTANTENNAENTVIELSDRQKEVINSRWHTIIIQEIPNEEEVSLGEGLTKFTHNPDCKTLLQKAICITGTFDAKFNLGPLAEEADSTYVREYMLEGYLIEDTHVLLNYQAIGPVIQLGSIYLWLDSEANSMRGNLVGRPTRKYGGSCSS